MPSLGKLLGLSTEVLSGMMLLKLVAGVVASSPRPRPGGARRELHGMEMRGAIMLMMLADDLLVCEPFSPHRNSFGTVCS